MADVETVVEPEQESNVETPAPVQDQAEEIPAEVVAEVPPEDDGALGKRKPEDDPQTEDEPPSKRASNWDAPPAEENGAQPEMDAPPAEEVAAPVMQVSQDITEYVPCPPTMVGRVIGKGGETIKALEAQNGARIQIDQETKQITITGSVSAVASTVRAVTELLDAPAETQTIAPEASDAIDCPPGLVGRIIGRGGETIKGLQAASMATISIDQNFPDGHPRKIHISGGAAAVANGRKLVLDLLEGGPSTAAQLLGSQFGPGVSMDCPKEMVGRVIGRGGETIKGLQQHSGAKIQIDQTGNPCKVTMAGPPQAVAEAQRMINDIINGGDGGLGGGGRGGYGGGGGYPQQGGYGAPAGYGYPQQGYGAPGGYMPQPQAGYGGYPQQGYGGYAAPQQGGAQQAYGQNMGYQQHYAQPAADTSAWQGLQDGEGRTYYYNSQTGVSQWEKPEGFP